MSDNPYPVDPKNSVELSRLLRQEPFMTGITGYLPPDVEPSSIRKTLDVGCGPGPWLIDLLKQYPDMHGAGIDISESMIEHAQGEAKIQRLQGRLEFFTGSFEHLPFPDESFDYINARLVQWFVSELDRPAVLREWFRVLRPGGWIRLIEAELPKSNGQANEILTQMFSLSIKQLKKTGGFVGIAYDGLDEFLEEIRAESPETAVLLANLRDQGSFFYLKRFLEWLGCEHIQVEPHIVDYSAHGPHREQYVEDILLSHVSFRNFRLKMLPGLTLQRLKSLEDAWLKEWQSPDFIALQLYVSAWGQKPLLSK